VNLLHNATKFTERGGHVTLDAHVNERVSPPTLALSVTDTGEGIPAGILPHVFDFFVQGDASRRPRSGLGIGLGLAKQLIDLHGGSIVAQSPGPGGRGSSFTITLPVLGWHSLSAPEEPAGAEMPPRVDKRVLAIDDNVDAADTLSALVVAVGGEARTAYDWDGRSQEL
jgi:hypothetical protein